MVKKVIITLGIVLISAGAIALFMAHPAFAQGAVENGINSAKGSGVPTTLFGGSGPSGVVTGVTNFMLFVIGALSVIMLIWGGIRYAVSGGNAASITAAKNTILYAIIGLVIAFLAFAAINFIISFIGGGGMGGNDWTNV